jgi:hypothetical protein
MLFWENEHPDDGVVHHLMVLCYHLQHPSLLSPDGLQGQMRLLADFLEGGITPQEVRWRDRSALDSGNRKYKIKGTPAAHGSYDHPIEWPMTTPDVINAGVDSYCDSVRSWAQSVLQTLRASGNFPPEGHKAENSPHRKSTVLHPAKMRGQGV